MVVSIEIANVAPQGAAIKVRFPLGLLYQGDSSIIRAGNGVFDIDPETNTADTEFRYLVYYVTQESFGQFSSGVLEFVLVAEDAVASGQVAVDADPDDPDVANADEFDISDPDFTAQGTVEIVVSGVNDMNCRRVA